MHLQIKKRGAKHPSFACLARLDPEVRYAQKKAYLVRRYDSADHGV